MQIESTSRKLLEGIEKEISKHSFKLIKRDKCFKRIVDQNIVQIFTILFTRKEDGISVAPAIHIKIKPIEDIYHQVAVKDHQYFDGTFTLGNSLFKIISYLEHGIVLDYDEKKSYLIEEEKDIEILIKVINERFKEYVLPYFDKNSSISRADELLNAYPREISIHNWLYPLRANLAIIAAKLNKNNEYTELIKIYEEELKGAQDSYKVEFNKLKEYWR